jgi:transcriptional regulator with XRE-family HTH domain
MSPRRHKVPRGITLGHTKVSPGYVGLMELGQRSPSIAVLQRLAKALGVPVTELLG